MGINGLQPRFAAASRSYSRIFCCERGNFQQLCPWPFVRIMLQVRAIAARHRNYSFEFRAYVTGMAIPA